MKKVIALILIAMTVLSITSCGSSDTPEQQGTETQENNISKAQVTEPEVSDSSERLVSESEESITLSDTNAQYDEDTIANKEKTKTLVAYFSRVGNTNFEDDVDVVTSASLRMDGGELIGNCEIVADMLVEKTGGDLVFIETIDKYPSDYRDTTDVAKIEQNNNTRPALLTHIENIDQYDTIILVYPNWWGTLPQPVFTFLDNYDFSGKTILPLATHEGSGLGRGPQDIEDICLEAILIDGFAIRGSDVDKAEPDISSWIDGTGIMN